jgi:hypothetical protein
MGDKDEDAKIARALVAKDLNRMARAVGPAGLVTDYETGLGGDDHNMVVFTIGVRGNLHRSAAKSAAKAWKQAIEKSPKAVFMPVIAGYDEDPRELWDFPEVRDYVRRWARFADLTVETLKTVAMLEGSVGFLAACGVFGDHFDVNKPPTLKRN